MGSMRKKNILNKDIMEKIEQSEKSLTMRFISS
jgi:hypothetical protein